MAPRNLAENARALALGASLVATLLLAHGCRGSSFRLAPVAGRVTLDGQPLAGARVAFEPRRAGESPYSGLGSYGTTDAQGYYVLTTANGQRGAVVATHDVVIRTAMFAADRGAEPSAPAKEWLPARYNNQSTLSFTVPEEGTRGADFALTSGP